MPAYLGIDTSNYTTSAALLTEAGLVGKGRLLPVRAGQLGLRQSDAVFEHTRQLPDMVEACFAQAGSRPLAAVGYSARPRDAEGSYMPCFLAGESAARAVAASWGVPAHGFSHQAGHVAAALYGAGRLDLARERFICFHFSGGTTDCLLASPDSERVLNTQLLYTSLDLKAGQAVDRVGALLGLGFPAGPALSALAEKGACLKKPRVPFKDGNASLSGLENQCAQMREAGEAPADIARYCLCFIGAVAQGMAERALAALGPLPVVFAGGVMCSSILRPPLEEKYGGIFAPPAYSSDNAAGAAVLAMLRHTGGAAE